MIIIWYLYITQKANIFNLSLVMLLSVLDLHLFLYFASRSFFRWVGIHFLGESVEGTCPIGLFSHFNFLLNKIVYYHYHYDNKDF